MILKGHNVNIVEESFKIKSEKFLHEISDKCENQGKQESLVDSKKMANKIIDAAKQEADDILNNIISQANDKAKSILISAENEADKLKQEAYNTGYKNGFEESVSNYKTKFEDLNSNFINSINSLALRQDEFIDNLNKNVVDISLTVANKIIRKQIDEDSKVLIPLIEDAILQKVKSDSIFLTISSSVKDIVSDIKNIFNLNGDLRNKEISINAKDMDEGTVLVHTDNGILDASVQSQLKKLGRFFTAG